MAESARKKTPAPRRRDDARTRRKTRERELRRGERRSGLDLLFSSPGEALVRLFEWLWMKRDDDAARRRSEERREKRREKRRRGREG